MGYYAKMSAAGALAADDAAPLAQDAPVWNAVHNAPISGCALRDGRSIPVTLENTMATETYSILPEQIVMAALLLVSFLAPICHLLG